MQIDLSSLGTNNLPFTPYYQPHVYNMITLIICSKNTDYVTSLCASLFDVMYKCMMWQSYPCTGLHKPLGFQEVEVPRISKQ